MSDLTAALIKCHVAEQQEMKGRPVSFDRLFDEVCRQYTEMAKHSGRMEDNARAAPELLEALMNCGAELGFNDPHDAAFESELAGQVRSAIAKALGK